MNVCLVPSHQRRRGAHGDGDIMVVVELILMGYQLSVLTDACRFLDVLLGRDFGGKWSFGRGDFLEFGVCSQGFWGVG